MAVDGKGLKIGDTMVPGLDNINDIGTANLRWKDGYFAGTLNVGSLGGKEVVTGGNIAKNTIGTDRLANGAVTSTKIADGTIATQDLTNNAVTSIKIADGTITGTDLATNYQSGSAYDSRFVNVSGDTMTGLLTVTGARNTGDRGMLEVTNTATSSNGIKGKATGAVGSAGIYGEATNNTSYGGRFLASGQNSVAVWGQSTDITSAANWGGLFTVDSERGHAVEGIASNNSMTAVNYGGYFMNAGRFGGGVYGEATGENAAGVIGQATNSRGGTGGYFKTKSSSGYSGYFEGGSFMITTPITGGDNPNYYIQQARIDTTGGSSTILHSTTLDDNKVYLFEARVIARQIGGSAGTVGDSAAYIVKGTFKRTAGGSATRVGAVLADFTAENQSAWDATLTAAGNNVYVQVKGEINKTIIWHATVIIQNLSN